MPLLRIDLLKGKTSDYRAQLGEIIYQAMLDCLNVPKMTASRSLRSIRSMVCSLIGIILAYVDRTITSFCRSP